MMLRRALGGAEARREVWAQGEEQACPAYSAIEEQSFLLCIDEGDRSQPSYLHTCFKRRPRLGGYLIPGSDAR